MLHTQQDELYAAEESVTTRGMTFATSREAQVYLDALRDTWWWQKFFWKAPARTEIYWKARGDSVGSYDKAKDAGLLEMVPAHRNELFILHELAHVVAEALHGSHAHDPYFARTYAVLVYCVLGSDAWLQLQRGYEAQCIEYLQND